MLIKTCAIFNALRSLRVLALIFILLGLYSEQSEASVIYFDVHWSGMPNGNAAIAHALIGIDETLIPNPGSFSNTSAVPTWFDSITLTISGASSGNGVFSKSDFAGVYWNTAGGALDFDNQLVGQSTDTQPWGSTYTGSSGDFNILRSAASAPTGTYYFQLTP